MCFNGLLGHRIMQTNIGSKQFIEWLENFNHGLIKQVLIKFADEVQSFLLVWLIFPHRKDHRNEKSTEFFPWYSHVSVQIMFECNPRIEIVIHSVQWVQTIDQKSSFNCCFHGSILLKEKEDVLSFTSFEWLVEEEELLQRWNTPVSVDPTHEIRIEHNFDNYHAGKNANKWIEILVQ